MDFRKLKSWRVGEKTGESWTGDRWTLERGLVDVGERAGGRGRED